MSSSISYRKELAELAERLGGELDLIPAETFEAAHTYLQAFAEVIYNEGYMEGRRDGSGYRG